MALQRCNTLRKFRFGDDPFGYHSFAKIVRKLQRERPAAVARRVNMNDRIDLNIHQACIAQHAGDAAADV